MEHHPHLGITKCSTRTDPSPDIISKGLKSFFALHGVGAYTSGLSPHLCAKLWMVFCIPRMLYGTPVHIFTTHEAAQINTAQYALFKRILGIPQSAANEAVFLLTGLIPLFSQIEQNCLLLIGQLANLPAERFGKRTLLQASVISVPLTKYWKRSSSNICQTSLAYWSTLFSTPPGRL